MTYSSRASLQLLVVLTTVVAVTILSTSANSAQGSDVESFAAARKGKLFQLRHLVSDSKITYDKEGNLVGKWRPGLLTWHSAVEVEKIEWKAGVFRITATRTLLNYSRSIHKFSPLRTGEKVEIDIQTSMKDDGQIDIQNEWNKAFLTTTDKYPENIQGYWIPFLECLRDHSSDECDFYEKKSWEPDVYNVKGGSTWKPSYPDVYSVGKDVTPPKIRSKVDPVYSDIARAAKVEGTVLLEAIVETDGHVRITRIIRPMGWGLEENAAETLAKWRFDPGRRNGEPVNVLMNVEVNFAFRR